MIRARTARRRSRLMLWLAGPLMLLAGAGLAYGVMRGRARAPEAAGLTAEERAELDKVLK
jgi:cytochrome c-type biogenesis protein CcmH